MKHYIDYDLFRHNTMRLHCIAKSVFFPETEEELSELVLSFKQQNKPFHIIGACSNIVLPSKIVIPVIFLTEFNKDFSIREGIIEVGASVRIQHLIRQAQKYNLGGIEYLFSVPCTVGGATVMNAGRGNGKQSIGNFIERVCCLNLTSGEIETLGRDECNFGYRNSIFLHGNRVVLSSFLKLEVKPFQRIEDDINERKEFALKYLDDRRPSCGSIFKCYNDSILKKLKGLRIGGAEWSPKKANWISNAGNAKSWQIQVLIRIAHFLHLISFKPCRLEVEVW